MTMTDITILSMILIACAMTAIHLAFVSPTRNERIAWFAGSLAMLCVGFCGAAFVMTFNYGVPL